MTFDLLQTVEYGGCSAKLAPGELAEALKDLPKVKHENLLVDIETHDDAGVYKIGDDSALVQTTDFFSPICSDPCEFGRIAAANALSDVYAMGGEALTALNLVMFPSQRIGLDVLREILRGGMETVQQAGAVIVGGHTIDDYPPKYGLAVTGMVHPKKIVSNDKARPGDVLILTKPIGVGILVAGHRIGEAKPGDYRAALDSMMQLNKEGGRIMQQHGVRCATDITGFGLLGHALKMALASGVTLEIESRNIAQIPGAYALLDMGCIPGAAFRNLRFAEEQCEFGSALDYNLKMLSCDAQTSGGLLMCVARKASATVVEKLKAEGYSRAAVVGNVIPKATKALIID
jgi:selenide,water dikinase